MDPTARDRPADSAMARGFGAEIAIGEPDGRALFLASAAPATRSGSSSPPPTARPRSGNPSTA